MKLFGKSTFQLVNGHTVGSFTFRTDKVGDGFGLGKVEFTVDESPSCKLASFGHTAAFGDEDLEQFLLHVHRAVRADFCRVFARERVRTFEERHQHLVEHHAIVNNLAEIGLMGYEFCHIERLSVLLK